MLSDEARVEARQLANELKTSGIITTHKHKLTSYKKAVVRRRRSCPCARAGLAATPAAPVSHFFPLLFSPSPPKTGAEMVDWMVFTERANSREEATQRGQQLIVGNLLCSATEERDFADSKGALYRCVARLAERVEGRCCCNSVCTGQPGHRRSLTLVSVPP